MSIKKSSSDAISSLAGYYGEDVLAVEEPYSGVFSDRRDQESITGVADLVVEHDEGIKIYEISESESLNQDILLERAMSARNQLDKAQAYFESKGFEVETEYMIVPKKHLASVYDISQELPEEFTLEQVKDTIEPARAPYIEENALEEVEEGIYQLDESLEALIETEIIHP